MLQNKIRYIMLLVLIGILAILYDEYVMGMIFLSFLVMPVILFIHLCYLYKKVDAHLISDIHIAGKGQEIPMSIQVYNASIFPVYYLKIYLTIRNTFSSEKCTKELIISMDGKSKRTVTCYLQSEYSGNLQICIKGIRSYDYLRLFSLKRKLKGEVKIAVLPEFYEIAEDAVSGRNRQIIESDHYSAIKSGDDPSEVFQIREYREGDRLQRVHWKLSSKQNQLMIKEFSDPINCSVLILADLFLPAGKSAPAYMNALLECTLSISYTFLIKKQIHFLAWYNEKNGACTRVRIADEKDFYEAVDGLLQSSPCGGGIDSIMAYHAEYPNEQLTDFIYIASELLDSRINTISMLGTCTKQIIYMKENADKSIAGETLNKSESSHTIGILQRMAEIGFETSVININNIKEEIENLKLV